MEEDQMQFDADMEVCIENCTECHRICLEAVTHCLRRGGAHSQPELIRLLLDCAQICQTSADFMIRNSELHQQTCAVCAHVCAHCANVCAGLGSADPQMQECADICAQCAESCRQQLQITN